MPVQFDLLKQPPLDFWGDLLRSHYAQPMASADLEKLRGAVTGQNLSNQAEQIKMPFIAPRQQADIDHIRALMQKAQQEANYIPTKYNLEGGRLDLGRQRLDFMKNKLQEVKNDVKLKFLKSLPEAARNTFLAATGDQQDQILSQYIKGYMPQNLPRTSPPQLNNNTENQPIPPNSQNQPAPPNSQNEMFRNAAEIAANKKLTSPKLIEQQNAFEQLNDFLNDPEIRDTLKIASKYAGIKGKGKQIWDAIFNSNPDDYTKLKDFKNILSSNYTNLSRRLENLGVQASTRKEIHHMISGAINDWDSNPERALNLFDRLNNQLFVLGNKIESQAHPVNPLGKKYSASAPVKLSSKQSLPKSHDPKEIKEWLKTASAQQRLDFANSLG